MTETDKEIEQAIKANDKKKLEELSNKQQAIMPQMTGIMFMQFRPLIIILAVLFILVPLIRSVFAGFLVELPFKIPVFITNLFKFDLLFSNFNQWLNWRSEFGPYGWFWISVLIAGFVVLGATQLWAFAKKRGVLNAIAEKQV